MDPGGDGASSRLIVRRHVARSGPSRCRRHAPSQHSLMPLSALVPRRGAPQLDIYDVLSPVWLFD
jgi:hypothetical protein